MVSESTILESRKNEFLNLSRQIKNKTYFPIVGYLKDKPSLKPLSLSFIKFMDTELPEGIWHKIVEFSADFGGKKVSVSGEIFFNQLRYQEQDIRVSISGNSAVNSETFSSKSMIEGLGYHIKGFSFGTIVLDVPIGEGKIIIECKSGMEGSVVGMVLLDIGLSN